MNDTTRHLIDVLAELHEDGVLRDIYNVEDDSNAPLEVQELRATNAELHARLSELLTIFAGAQSIPQPTDPAGVEEIRAICRKAVAMRGAAWRDGAPPANALVLRERPDGALQAVYTVLDAGRVCILRSSGDVVLWGTARWCPIVGPA